MLNNKILRNILYCLVGCFTPILPSDAASEDFIGKWLLTLENRSEPRLGTLELIIGSDEIKGFVDGGPIEVDLNDDEIHFLFDWEGGGGEKNLSELRGVLSGNSIVGYVYQDGEATGTWSADRRESIPGLGEPADPSNLNGTWDMLTYDGTAKSSFSLTDAAKQFQEGFNARLHDPALRCVSDGLVRVTGGPFAMEIIQQEDKVTILHEDMHEVRRIYTDGREFSDDVNTMFSSLGYSIGHWEGSTLVVETRGLKDAVWHRSGTPISHEAVVTEYIYIGEAGNLHLELELNDPKNFKRPPLRHTVWKYSPDYQIPSYECDPHAFFRGMYLEGELEEYFNTPQYRR